MKFKKLKVIYYGNDLASIVADYNARGWAIVKWKLCWKKGDVSKLTFIKKIK